SCGIYYSGSLTINGDGTLDVTGGTGAEGSPAYDSDGGTGKTGGYGIWGKGDLSISGGAVKIRGGDGGKGGFGKGKGNANIGGKGGTGGDAVHFLTTAVLTMDENVTAIGGDGGRYGGDVASGLPSAEGGNGGNAISSDESLTLNKTTNAVGGNGHNGDGTCTSQDPSAGSVGGDGGNGIFVAKDLKFAATVFAKGGKGGRGKGAVSSSGGAVGDGKDGGKGGKGGDGMSAVGTITIEQGEVTAKGGDGGRGGDGGSPSEAIIAGKPTIAGKGGKGGKGGDGVSSCTNLTTLLKSKLLTANGGNGGGGGNSGTVPKKTADVNTGDKKKSGANKSIGNIITQKFFSVLTPLKPKSAVDSLLVFDAFGGIISNTSGDLTASYKKAIGNVTAESVKIDGTGFTLFGGDALPFGTGKDGAWSALGKGDAYTLPFGTGKGDLATGAVGGKDVVSGDFKDGALVIGTGKDGNIKITASHNGTPGGAGLPFNGNIGGNGGAGGELGKVLDNQNGFNFIGNPSSVAGNDYFLAIADNTASAIYTPVISKDKNGNLFGNIDFSNVPIKLIDGTTDSTDPPQAPFVADEFFPTNNSFATATIEKTEYKSQGKSGETDVKNVPAGLGSEFVINMTTKEKQNGVVTATLSVNAIKTLHKEGFEGVKMITNTGSVAFDKEVLRQLEKAGTAMTLNMKTSTDGTMEFYITNPAGEKQNFSGEYTFGITTELYNDANPNFAQFYFLPENGKPAVPIAKSSFSSDGQMMFVKTRHNSRYAVGYRTDVPKYTDIANHWAKDDIEFVVAKRLLGGVTPDKFAPDSGLTCGEFILALSIVEGKDMIDLYKGDLSKPMTREQMAQIMLDFAVETGFNFSQTREEMFFTDTQSEAVRVMQMSGIIMGKDANSFDPKGIATKSAAASVLRRYIELLFDKSTAQGLDVNDSGKYVYYLNGKMIRAASDEGGKITIDGISYNFDKNGFGTKLGTAALADKKYILHKVVRGDTLSGIAKKYHTTVAEIAKLNNIKNVSNVPVGT
ncbi:MAG: LysM domain-containing protein, partial [Oscillospiraceae bacterium]